MLEIDAVNGVTAGLSSFYFLQILERYIWEYVDGFGMGRSFIKADKMRHSQADDQADNQAQGGGQGVDFGIVVFDLLGSA